MSEIVILGNEASYHHSKPLEQHFRERITVESDWRPSVVGAHNPHLVITFEESHPERGLCIGEMSNRGVATLLMMDGIPEWRNTWSRRGLANKRPINQPILAHKVGCLGKADARIYESWGNVGKCEVVGSPRFDEFVGSRRNPRVEPILDRPMRLLVMTAKTPGFTQEEVEITYGSLEHLRDELAQRRDIQVIWRITKGLHKRLKVTNTLRETTGKELFDVLGKVDAVITTPSTVMLEGMLFGHPVALLDYHNCPHYIPAAWRITCRDQISSVLEDLRNVPLDRMVYQDYCLRDALACQTPALPRALKLIEEMIRIRRECDTKNARKLTFPHRILDQPEEFVTWPSGAFNLKELYPYHSMFGRSDMIAMQAKLEAALGTVDQLKDQVNVLTNRLHRIPGYLLAKRLSQIIQNRLNK